MESHPVSDESTDLSLLFKPVDVRDLSKLRAQLGNIDVALENFHRALISARPSGWHLQRTQLDVFPSGQVCITAYVEDNEISFCVGLRPRNFYANAPAKTEWVADADVYVDGPEGRNYLVFNREAGANSPEEGIEALERIVDDLHETLPQKPPTAAAWTPHEESPTGN
jgi:hypothetical protein